MAIDDSAKKVFVSLLYRYNEWSDADSANSESEWWDIYNRLVKWQIDFEEQKEASLIQILYEQFLSCNRNFTKFEKLFIISMVSLSFIFFSFIFLK